MPKNFRFLANQFGGVYRDVICVGNEKTVNNQEYCYRLL
jgi:hypothetical protein